MSAFKNEKGGAALRDADAAPSEKSFPNDAETHTENDKKGKRVIFSVPALSLVNQTVAAFESERIHCIGVMQADHLMTDPTRAIVFAKGRATHGWS